MTITIPRIELSPKLKKELATKHEVTLQHVRNALKYHSKSQKSEQIRTSAIELLQEEATKASVKVS